MINFKQDEASEDKSYEEDDEDDQLSEEPSEIEAMTQSARDRANLWQQIAKKKSKKTIVQNKIRELSQNIE